MTHVVTSFSKPTAASRQCPAAPLPLTARREVSRESASGFINFAELTAPKQLVKLQRSQPNLSIFRAINDSSKINYALNGNIIQLTI